MNITKLIKNDEVLSRFDFEVTYRIVFRLEELGLLGK